MPNFNLSFYHKQMLETQGLSQEDRDQINRQMVQDQFGAKLVSYIFTALTLLINISKIFLDGFSWKEVFMNLLFCFFIFLFFRIFTYVIVYLTRIRFRFDVRAGRKNLTRGKVIDYNAKKKYIVVKNLERELTLYLSGCTLLDYEWDHDEQAVYFDNQKNYQFEFLPRSKLVLKVTEDS